MIQAIMDHSTPNGIARRHQAARAAGPNSSAASLGANVNQTLPLRCTGLFAATLACFAACDNSTIGGPPVELGNAGARVRVSVAPFSISIANDKGETVLRSFRSGASDGYGGPSATIDEGTVGTRLLPGWDGFTPAELPWANTTSARVLSEDGAQATFELRAGAGTLVLRVSVEGAKVTLDLEAQGQGWNKTTLPFALGADEHLFGLGERFASVDHRGLSMYSWAEEGPLGGGEQAPRSDTNPYPNGPSMTYFPVPFFLSSAGYAMHLATTHRTEVHFGSERPEAFRVAASDTRLRAVIYVHDAPTASLDDFTRDTGRPLVPAPWVFGPRRRVSAGQDVDGVLEFKKLRQAKIPTTGLDDAVHFLPARSELGREDVLREWVKSAHALGYKVMAYNNPYVSTTIGRAAEDLAYGKANKLFATTDTGALAQVFFISGEGQSVATIDLTIPEGVRWFQSLLRRTVALGYDGWMHDFGEYVRRDFRFGDGRTGAAVHNEYPVLSAKAAYEVLSQDKPNDFLFFVRSGYTGTQAWVPAVWGGDAEATFDETQGLPSAVRSGLNLGMSGVPLWGSDVTGFKCITNDPRDKEIYLRWAQVGAVSPIMMEQNACSHPLGRTKWKLWNDQETMDVYGAAARLHTRLAPYFEVQAQLAHDTGMPIMRHPFLLYPKHPEAQRTESTFFLGPDLFALPVVRRGEREKQAWLPPGRWIDLDDDTVYTGDQRVRIPAPLAKLPLLLREGGIVPLLDPSVETLAPATDPSVITRASTDDRLDVLVALAEGDTARIKLQDGTELVAQRRSGVTGQAPQAVSPAEVTTCQGASGMACVATTQRPGFRRVQLSTAQELTSRWVYEDLELTATNPRARRVRWNVALLPR